MKNSCQWTINQSDVWVRELKRACFFHAVFDFPVSGLDDVRMTLEPHLENSRPNRSK